ncbi:MAG: IclR family transcriptional regulator [Alphaproteobacteria bacterium]|jgi:DNA-binding IclR family transcriptional regulator|nr:transcriptional regulator [Rhodospirillaceae bacterium]MDP6405199.1 IclR family transcriptional regulator [Alphaproteobacteria bacterium]MDP6623100.1 IclR family transcriptional regulator [Alphaproteobacteria bacterium]
MTMAKHSGSKEKGGVQSLARAFALLEAIAGAPDGIGLAQLSKAVGLHSSTAFHLVKTMVQFGYVRQERATKRYRLGRPLFLLAARAREEVELINVATPLLEKLAEATSESSHLAVRSGHQIVILARTDGSSPFRLNERLGALRPAHATALGKILLARLEPEQFEGFLAENSLDACTPNTITDAVRLRRELATVRDAGIAFDDAEYHSEVRCAAVAIYDFTGHVTGAIGISGPIWRLSLSALQEKVPLVRETAARISEELGYQGDMVANPELEKVTS